MNDTAISGIYCEIEILLYSAKLILNSKIFPSYLGICFFMKQNFEIKINKKYPSIDYEQRQIDKSDYNIY